MLVVMLMTVASVPHDDVCRGETSPQHASRFKGVSYAQAS